MDGMGVGAHVGRVLLNVSRGPRVENIIGPRRDDTGGLEWREGGTGMRLAQSEEGTYCILLRLAEFIENIPLLIAVSLDAFLLPQSLHTIRYA